VSRISKSKKIARRKRGLFVRNVPMPTSLEPMDGQGSATHPNAGEIFSTSTLPGMAKKTVDEFGYKEGN